MINHRRFTTVAAFLSLALNGLVLTAMGTSLPLVRDYLGIDINQGGTLMAVMQVGFTLFSLVAGLLSDSQSRERILMAGCVLLGLGTFFFCNVPSYSINLFITFVIGAGIGAILSGSNTLLISLYPARKGAILNIHHIFFGLGSLLGPLVIGILIAIGLSWKLGFSGLGLLLLLVALYFFLVKAERPQHRAGYSFGKQVKQLVADKHFWVLLGVNGLSMGVQVTIMLLGVTYLIEAKGSSLIVAGGALSLFSVCIMIGRLLCSRLTLSYNHVTIILLLLWLQLLVMLLVWLLPGSFAIVLLAISGFTFSGIYPTSLALAGILFPQVAGSALGVLSTMGGIGTIVLCWITGYVADLTHMSTGFIVMILASLVAVVLFQINRNPLRNREGDAIG